MTQQIPELHLATVYVIGFVSGIGIFLAANFIKKRFAFVDPVIEKRR